MAAFHYTPEQFWNSLPIEIYHAFSSYIDMKMDESKERWEMMRMQTYYLIDIQLPQKSKIDYEKFKNSYMSFTWDIPNKITSEPIRLTNDDWAELDRIAAEQKKKKVKKTIDYNSIKNKLSD